MNGFRSQPQGSRKERLRELEVEIKNLSMSVRISQMMTQQIMQNLKPMHEDLARVTGLIQELQYKVLAAQKVSGVDVELLNAAANEMRLSDFNEASDREDKEHNFTVGDVVNEQSTIVLTSITEEKDRGIFRSRLKLSECGVPDLITALMGRQVGAKAIVKLNGLDHNVELLGIRQPTASAAADGSTEESNQDVSDDLPTEAQSSEVVGNA